jgi:hypothetical protein
MEFAMSTDSGPAALGPLALNTYRFPGPAGIAQDRGDGSALIVELGRNYDQYHEAVAAEHADVEQRLAAMVPALPRVDVTGKPMDGLIGGVSGGIDDFSPAGRVPAQPTAEWHERYLDLTTRRMELRHAEVLLRVARRAVVDGVPADLTSYDPQASPLVDVGGVMTSVHDTETTAP